MRQRIELATNLAVIALAALLIVVFARSAFVPAARPGDTVGIRAGDRLPETPGLKLSPVGATLVMAIRAGCRFCEASMPFYAELAALHRAGKLDTALLAVLPDDAPTAKLLLAAHGVDLPLAAGVPLSDLDVRGTPTLILVRPDRRVLRVWVGQLPVAEQRDLIAALAGREKS